MAPAEASAPAADAPPDPVVAGAYADHPLALCFAREVRRVHHRYAVEVVAAFRLCPFLADPAKDFGRFCVMLERTPDVDAAFEQVAAAQADDASALVHLVYPLVLLEPARFERFAMKLHELVARKLPHPPVHATFHPDLEGDDSTPARLVGVMRRAPDPFVQFVPEGLQKGGTGYVDLATADLAKLLETPRERAMRTFERLRGATLETIVARLADIRADRERSYTPFLAALAAT